MTFKDTFVIYNGTEVHPMSCTVQYEDGIELITASGKHILFLPNGTYSIEAFEVKQTVVKENFVKKKEVVVA